MNKQILFYTLFLSLLSISLSIQAAYRGGANQQWSSSQLYSQQPIQNQHQPAVNPSQTLALRGSDLATIKNPTWSQWAYTHIPGAWFFLRCNRVVEGKLMMGYDAMARKMAFGLVTSDIKGNKHFNAFIAGNDVITDAQILRSMFDENYGNRVLQTGRGTATNDYYISKKQVNHCLTHATPPTGLSLSGQEIEFHKGNRSSSEHQQLCLNWWAGALFVKTQRNDSNPKPIISYFNTEKQNNQPEAAEKILNFFEIHSGDVRLHAGSYDYAFSEENIKNIVWQVWMRNRVFPVTLLTLICALAAVYYKKIYH